MKSLNQCRVNVMVSDMDDAVKFYVDTLGFDLLNRYGEHYAEIRAANLIIGLHPKGDAVSVGNNLSIGFGVSNFDETIKDLQDRGVTLRIGEDESIRLAHFSDPDGNQLFLAENKE